MTFSRRTFLKGIFGSAGAVAVARHTKTTEAAPPQEVPLAPQFVTIDPVLPPQGGSFTVTMGDRVSAPIPISAPSVPPEVLNLVPSDALTILSNRLLSDERNSPQLWEVIYLTRPKNTWHEITCFGSDQREYVRGFTKPSQRMVLRAVYIDYVARAIKLSEEIDWNAV